MTNPLDLIKRLARHLADRTDAHGESCPAEQNALYEARAFLDGAVEFEQRDVGVVDNGGVRFLSEPGSVELQFLHNVFENARAETDALRSVPPGPVSVHIIVRPKGDG